MHDKDFVKITYSGVMKENGMKLDTAENAPIVVGAKWVIPGVDDALKDMKVGEKKSVEIPPEKGFGERDPKLIKLVPEAEFKKHGQTPVPGMVVNADNARGRVLSVSSGRVKVDFNHPLAGRTLVYEVQITSKIEDEKEKILGIIQYYARQPVDDVKVFVNGDEVEIFMPPIVNSVYKKRMATEMFDYLGKKKVKFSEVFEKPKEEKK